MRCMKWSVCVCGVLMVTAKRAGCWHAQSSNHAIPTRWNEHSEHKRHGGLWRWWWWWRRRTAYFSQFIYHYAIGERRAESSVELFLNTWRWRIENKIRSCAPHTHTYTQHGTRVHSFSARAHFETEWNDNHKMRKKQSSSDFGGGGSAKKFWIRNESAWQKQYTFLLNNKFSACFGFFSSARAEHGEHSKGGTIQNEKRKTQASDCGTLDCVCGRAATTKYA